MLITAQKGNTRLPPQGIYAADLQSVSSKNESKNISLDFKIPGYDELVSKIAPASFALGPLKDDCQTLNGRPFSDSELQAGVDPARLIGTKCQVVLVHKKTSGK